MEVKITIVYNYTIYTKIFYNIHIIKLIHLNKYNKWLISFIQYSIIVLYFLYIVQSVHRKLLEYTANTFVFSASVAVCCLVSMSSQLDLTQAGNDNITQNYKFTYFTNANI